MGKARHDEAYYLYDSGRLVGDLLQTTAYYDVSLSQVVLNHFFLVSLVFEFGMVSTKVEGEEMYRTGGIVWDMLCSRWV
ncbi:hypothetical protein N7465_001190 [Penicillium sp. CMV-2018d]|nr:hypothetical protein N7465_001190 [Penicillium sp. CMV-2018d]